ncbi:MAG: arsenate reductase ArsC [candidate division Zixibacteria bacterium]|nr:arsenate reductase ArsC [candidate division Zixibacteria bacterium]
MERKWKVLFLCTANSSRSQMAEGFLRSWADNKYDVQSAGISPSSLNPLAMRAMQEIWVDISKQKSKSVELFLKEKFDYIITVCDNAREACPNFPGEVKKIHWSFEDPANSSGDEDEKTKVFRKVRDQIAEKIKGFIKITPELSRGR